MRLFLASLVAVTVVLPDRALATSPLEEAAVAAEAGDCERSVKLLARVKGANPDAALVTRIATAAEACRGADRVVGFALTERLAEVAPGNLAAVLAHADTLEAMDQRTDALVLLDKAIKKSPGDSRLKARRAKLADAPPKAGTRPEEEPVPKAGLARTEGRKPVTLVEASETMLRTFCERARACHPDAAWTNRTQCDSRIPDLRKKLAPLDGALDLPQRRAAECYAALRRVPCERFVPGSNLVAHEVDPACSDVNDAMTRLMRKDSDQQPTSSP